MAYYIYHIPERQKIGVTDNLARRMKQHDCDSYEILEEHSCIYEVSRREHTLQAEHGYPIDRIPYWHTVAMADHVKGGSASYKSQRKLTLEDARAIRASELNHVQCAKLYGVSRATIRGIRDNRTYLE
jgi:hypothetical protein